MSINTQYFPDRNFLLIAVKKVIKPAQVVLDIGCGIHPQNHITPAVHICCEPFRDYIEYLQREIHERKGVNLVDRNYVFLNAAWSDMMKYVPEQSVDTVFLLDVIEHLDKAQGEELLAWMEKTARCQVVVFTPLGFVKQEHSNGKDAWGMNGGKWQEHKSGWIPEDFDDTWQIYATKNLVHWELAWYIPIFGGRRETNCHLVPHLLPNHGDSQRAKLFLSRDRFGVKPLIYYFDNIRFAFASEMKAFLALDWFHLEFDPSMVSAALTNGGLIEGNEDCLLQGLKHLLGGHCLTMKPGERPQIRRWWRTLDHLEKVPERYEDQATRFRELFLDACRIRMRSDVPIGTALSGGLDSSSVICGMRHLRNTNTESDRLANDWQKAFVVTYPGSDVDERKYADVVIKHTGVTPVYCVGNADMYMEYFDDILFHLEEIADVPLGPWLAYKTQRENGVVVTLDGHGADEILAGYSWYVTAAIKDAIKGASPIQAGALLKTLKGLGVFSGDHILTILKNYSTKQINRTNHPWLLKKPVKFAPSNYIEDLPLTQNKSALDKSLYIDFHFTQLPTILRNFDRIAMAHGVEIRAPFMDWRLVTYLFSLPASAKIGSGFTKRILRDALKDILPETIRTRTRKLGFPTLAEAWTSPRTQEYVRDVTASFEFQQSTIWNGRKIIKDLEIATRNQDAEQIHHVLIFAQAMSLMKSFREKQYSSHSLENRKLGN